MLGKYLGYLEFFSRHLAGGGGGGWKRDILEKYQEFPETYLGDFT